MGNTDGTASKAKLTGIGTGGKCSILVTGVSPSRGVVHGCKSNLSRIRKSKTQVAAPPSRDPPERAGNYRARFHCAYLVHCLLKG